MLDLIRQLVALKKSGQLVSWEALKLVGQLIAQVATDMPSLVPANPVYKAQWQGPDHHGLVDKLEAVLPEHDPDGVKRLQIDWQQLLTTLLGQILAGLGK